MKGENMLKCHENNPTMKRQQQQLNGSKKALFFNMHKILPLDVLAVFMRFRNTTIKCSGFAQHLQIPAVCYNLRGIVLGHTKDLAKGFTKLLAWLVFRGSQSDSVKVFKAPKFLHEVRN